MIQPQQGATPYLVAGLPNEQPRGPPWHPSPVICGQFKEANICPVQGPAPAQISLPISRVMPAPPFCSLQEAKPNGHLVPQEKVEAFPNVEPNFRQQPVCAVAQPDPTQLYRPVKNGAKDVANTIRTSQVLSQEPIRDSTGGSNGTSFKASKGRSRGKGHLRAPPKKEPHIRKDPDDKEWNASDMPDSAAQPRWQTRCCLVGLVVLVILRGCAVNIYNSPAGLAWTAHMLSCSSDSIAIVGATPILFSNSVRACVNHRCLGSLLTLLLTATVCDFGAAIIFLSTAGGVFRLMGPVATDEGAPKNFAFIGVWECILLASVSLEFALCISTWQFYRSFREAGIYPPNATNRGLYKRVSPLEFLCEAEDVALLSDQCHTCHHDNFDTGDEMGDSVLEFGSGGGGDNDDLQDNFPLPVAARRS
mmetsp:Transcript_77039/g.160318  ORF Transcript_77039/g.160318 Transcript_77039/m.160318 type:complete len:419 (+) Transcript_77039:36-1292(+)